MATAPAPFQLPERPLEVDVIAKYFRGFGDPTRLRILELLADGERSVGELVDAIGVPSPRSRTTSPACAGAASSRVAGSTGRSTTGSATAGC